MNNSIEFYFDFVSPYTYLAHKRIIEIEKLEPTLKKGFFMPMENFCYYLYY